MPIKILIADDHPLLLNGTKEFLENKNFKVIATALDGFTAYNKIVNLQPDVAILDFDMPRLNGLEIAQKLKRNKLPTKIVILTLYKEESIVKQVGKTIYGYLTKDSALEELETCLNSIINNTNYIGEQLKTNIHFNTNSDSELDTLSPAELKILKYLDKNFTSTQIAEELFISKRTVEKHRSNIIKKLNIDTSIQNALIIWLKNHPNILDS